MLDKVVIATGNIGKYNELKAILTECSGGTFAREIIFAPELAKIEIDETEKTYAANARIKAQAWAQVSGLPCLADDSGLEVKALNGAPGIYSARVAPGSGARIQWILDNMKIYKEKEERRARFVASLMLIIPPSHNISSNGICNGYIAESVAGTGGFGYDPIFIPDGFSVSFAELPPETKNKISHRAIAAKNLIKILEQSSLGRNL